MGEGDEFGSSAQRLAKAIISEPIKIPAYCGNFLIYKLQHLLKS